MTSSEAGRPASVEIHRFRDDGSIPNNPALPLTVMRGAVSGSDRAAAFEDAFARNGWEGAWRDGIYGEHHYHSNAHEVLGIASGEAMVRFGGELGSDVVVRAGDVVVVPAGTGHKKLSGSPDLVVVGAYPRGQQPDMCTGEPAEHARAVARVARVPLPEADPLFGSDGPLMRQWNARAGAR